MVRIIKAYTDKSKKEQEYLANVLQKYSDDAVAAKERIQKISKMIDDGVEEKKIEDRRKLAEHERK